MMMIAYPSQVTVRASGCKAVSSSALPLRVNRRVFVKREPRVVTDNFIEIERKFLISDINPLMLPDHRETVIEETFLLSREANLDRRVRAEYSQGEVRYYLVEKYLTSKPAIGFKRREEISRRRFGTLKNRRDPQRDPVRKTRWEFAWHSQQLRIDKYDGPFEGLLILEAVLTHEEEDLHIPGFCTVVREVTGEEQYYWPRIEQGQRPGHIRKRAASFYIVALVDLLGQGDKLGEFAGIPKTAKEKRTFSRLTRATFGTVERFRERIMVLNRALPKAHAVPDAVKERLDPRQLRLVARSLEPAIGVQFFTDLALLKINLGGQRGHRPLITLYGLLRQLGLLMLTQLAEGVLFRGAVEAGICAELSGSDLYGQAIARASRLESDVAVYPRIVVGRDVMDYVGSFAKKHLTGDERAISDSYIEIIHSCLREDTDGVLTFFYLDPLFRRCYFGHENDFSYVVKTACRSIQRHQDTRCQGDAHLGERLARVEEYFRSQGCWTER
jgi:CYTH domain-containing protein